MYSSIGVKYVGAKKLDRYIAGAMGKINRSWPGKGKKPNGLEGPYFWQTKWSANGSGRLDIW